MPDKRVEAEGISTPELSEEDFVRSGIEEVALAMAKWSVSPTPVPDIKRIDSGIDEQIAKALFEVEVVDPHFENLNLEEPQGLYDAASLTLAKAEAVKEQLSPRERKKTSKFQKHLTSALIRGGAPIAALVTAACGPIVSGQSPTQETSPTRPVASEVVPGLGAETTKEATELVQPEVEVGIRQADKEIFGSLGGRVLSAAEIDFGQGRKVVLARLETEVSPQPGEIWLPEKEEDRLNLIYNIPYGSSDWGSILKLEEQVRKIEGDKGIYFTPPFTKLPFDEAVAFNIQVDETTGGWVGFEFRGGGTYEWNSELLNIGVYLEGDNLQILGLDASQFPDQPWTPFAQKDIAGVENLDSFQVQIIRQPETTLFVVVDDGGEIGRLEIGQDMFPDDYVVLGLNVSPGSSLTVSKYEAVRPQIKTQIETKAAVYFDGEWIMLEIEQENKDIISSFVISEDKKAKPHAPPVTILSESGEVHYPVENLLLTGKINAEEFIKLLEKPQPTPEQPTEEVEEALETNLAHDIIGQVEGVGWVEKITGEFMGVKVDISLEADESSLYGSERPKRWWEGEGANRVTLNPSIPNAAERFVKAIMIAHYDAWRMDWPKDSPPEKADVGFEEFMQRVAQGEDMSYEIYSSEDAFTPDGLRTNNPPLSRVDPSKPVRIVLLGDPALITYTVVGLSYENPSAGVEYTVGSGGELRVGVYNSRGGRELRLTASSGFGWLSWALSGLSHRAGQLKMGATGIDGTPRRRSGEIRELFYDEIWERGKNLTTPSILWIDWKD